LCDQAVEALLHSQNLVEVQRAGIIIRELNRGIGRRLTGDPAMSIETAIVSLAEEVQKIRTDLGAQLDVIRDRLDIMEARLNDGEKRIAELERSIYMPPELIEGIERGARER
jgi:hypothetical protein